MLAVLAAVTAVLKSQGGKETETEYFAALMSTLEVEFSCYLRGNRKRLRSFILV